VWPMIVAPPGSLKTEMLSALKGENGTHFIDQITDKTFISGQIDRPGSASKDPPGLLQRIKSGVVIFSDFSTVLAMQLEKRKVILADMRCIYDGHLHKEFGFAADRNRREWEGRITFMVAATPDVDRSYSIFQTLGERFVMIRCNRANGTDAALSAMRQDRKHARQELRDAVRSLLAALPKCNPLLPEEIEMKIAALSELVVHARTHVARDGHKKEIRYVPSPEAPTRLSQQLAQLAKGSALLDGCALVTDEDYKLVRRVGMDCIPAVRRRILEYLMTGDESKVSELPASTRSYAEEELEALGLISGRRDEAQPSLKAQNWMCDADLG
jgi:hypothetical protein